MNAAGDLSAWCTYEPVGSIHIFSVPEDNAEPTGTFMVVYGANINFYRNGNFVNIMDATDIMQIIEWLVRERGLEPARYILPGQAGYTTCLALRADAHAPAIRYPFEESAR